MSIKKFHIFFIIISSLLGLGMSLWGYQGRGVEEYSTLILVMGVILLVSLIPYLFWFRQKIKSGLLALSLFAIQLLPQTTHACSTCFGDPNALSSKGIFWGVIFLGGMIVGVLATILTITIQWSKRSRTLTSTTS